jgi:rubrerythrin
MWMGLVAVAVTAGFMAVSVLRAEETASVATPGASQKKEAGWSTKHTGKTFKKPPKQTVKYVCPMGDYVGDKPGKCPKCGMELKRTVVTPEKKAVPVQK